MMQDRTLLGQLFFKCVQVELNFLTNSGLWFGFMLGLVRLVVALFWDNLWALSFGGTIVWLVTPYFFASGCAQSRECYFVTSYRLTIEF